MTTSLRLISSCSLLAILCAPAVAQCTNPWLAENAAAGLNGEVYAMHRWDRDGAGPLPELWVFAGTFTLAGAIPAGGIVAFDPATTTWSPLGAGVDGLVHRMVTLPNGDLVVAGEFTTAGGIPTSHIAEWNGTTWSAIGSGFAGTVHALTLRPSGTLVAGSGGVVAEWDGSTWQPLGSPFTSNPFPNFSTVRALAALPNGDVLATGALLQLTPGGPSQWVVRWDGTSWTPFGTAAQPQPLIAGNEDLIVRSNGDVVLCGAALHLLAGGVTTATVAIWNGNAWTTSGIYTSLAPYRLCELTSGDLIAAGPSGWRVSRLIGGFWEPLGLLSGTARVVCALPGGELLAAGNVVSGPAIANAARWNGSTWLPVGEGGWTADTASTTVRPDGSVVVALTRNPWTASSTTFLGTRTASGWTSLGTTTQRVVLACRPNGEVIAGGEFTQIGGVVANRIARWNGGSWAPLGNGLGISGGERVMALAVAPNGDVIVGGRFAVPFGGTPLNSIARWNGASWSALGAGFTGEVYSLAVMPNGDVIAGGYLQISTSLQVARWNGTTWQPLATGFSNQVSDLAVRHDGSIVASGPFTLPGALGPATPTGVAIWSPVTGTWSGAGTLAGGSVDSLLTAPNGDLVIGGTFTAYDGVACAGIARWNGTTWSPFGSGAQSVADLALAPNGDVVVAGSFVQAGGVVSPHVARLSTTCPASVASIGTSCSGAGASPTLVATSLPWLGTTFRSRATGLPADTLALEVLAHSSLSVPLNAILPQGVAGCTLTTAPELLNLYVPAAGAIDLALPLASSIAFVGTSIYQQIVALSFGPSLDLVAMTSSNSLQLTKGAF